MKNKRILCLVDRYYPESSANTHCANFIMQKFIQEGYTVDFMSIKYDPVLPSVEQREGSIVYKIETYIIKNLRKYGKKFKATKWKEMPWLFRKTAGVVNKSKLLFKYYTESIYIDVINHKSIYELIESQEVAYDAIFSFSFPFALHIIANKIKKRGLAKKWFPIFLDPFVFNYTLKKNRIRNRKKVAIKVLEDADKIFMVRGIKEENIKQHFEPAYHSNVKVIELPNLVKPSSISLSEPKNRNSNEINLVYAGSFYKDIRNPSSMLDILSKLPNNMKITIMSTACEDIIERKRPLFKGNLEILGQVEYNKCQQNLASADILINLGNTIPNQTPSKVFEYIALGRPIVNFYFNENDTSLYYFKKYPLALNINVNSYTDKDVKNIIDFCNKNKNTIFSYEEATKDLQDSLSTNVVQSIFNETNDILKLNSLKRQS